MRLVIDVIFGATLLGLMGSGLYCAYIWWQVFDELRGWTPFPTDPEKKT